MNRSPPLTFASDLRIGPRPGTVRRSLAGLRGPPRASDPTHASHGVGFSIPSAEDRANRLALPLICKAGHVTKREIGSIGILDHQSRFEVVADRANGFAAAIGNRTGKKAVGIQRIEGGGKVEEPAGSSTKTKKQHRKGPSAHAPKPRPDSAPA